MSISQEQLTHPTTPDVAGSMNFITWNEVRPGDICAIRTAVYIYYPERNDGSHSDKETPSSIIQEIWLSTSFLKEVLCSGDTFLVVEQSRMAFKSREAHSFERLVVTILYKGKVGYVFQRIIPTGHPLILACRKGS